MLHRRSRSADRGSVLPLVLVFTVIIGMVVVAVASYTTTGLRFGRAIEARADRLAAADGGLRYAIQKLKKVGHHECPTIDPPDVNGATVTLTCTPVGASFSDTEGYALVLTGEGLPSSTALFSAQGAASTAKRINGLVYMNRLDFDLSAIVRFENGQMQYSSSSPCPTTHEVRDNGSVIDTSLSSSEVQFSDDHFGIVCTTQPWSRDAYADGKFSEPFRPDLSGLPVDPAPVPDPGGGSCTVFLPGHYTSPPALGSYNYFRSGNYLFDNFTLTIENQKVTAGRVLDGNGSVQAIPNTHCDIARQSDNVTNVTEAGATFYLQNGARIVVNQNGTLEVLRRKQGKSHVGVHVLDTSLSATDDVLLQGPGTNKDMAIHGMVWAPTARITLSNVANLAEAQLLGGAVISNIKVDSSAGATGLVISVEPGDITGLLQLDSIATTADGRSTTIRSIVDYRPSTKYAAATSWRVIN
jgi:hypothetical protein